MSVGSYEPWLWKIFCHFWRIAPYGRAEIGDEDIHRNGDPPEICISDKFSTSAMHCCALCGIICNERRLLGHIHQLLTVAIEAYSLVFESGSESLSKSEDLQGHDLHEVSLFGETRNKHATPERERGYSTVLKRPETRENTTPRTTTSRPICFRNLVLYPTELPGQFMGCDSSRTAPLCC